MMMKILRLFHSWSVSLIALVGLWMLSSCSEEIADEHQTVIPEDVSTPVVTELGIAHPVKTFASHGGVFSLAYNGRNQFATLSYKHDSKKYMRLWRMVYEPLNFFYKEDNYSTYLLKRYYKELVQDDWGKLSSMLVLQQVDNSVAKQELHTDFSFVYDDAHRLIKIEGKDETNRKIEVRLTWNERGDLKEWKRLEDGEAKDGYTFTYGDQMNVGGIFIEEQMAHFQDSPFLYFSGMLGRPSKMLPVEAMQLDGTSFRFDYELVQDKVVKVKTYLKEDEQAEPMTDVYGY